MKWKWLPKKVNHNTWFSTYSHTTNWLYLSVDYSSTHGWIFLWNPHLSMILWLPLENTGIIEFKCLHMLHSQKMNADCSIIRLIIHLFPSLDDFSLLLSLYLSFLSLLHLFLPPLAPDFLSHCKAPWNHHYAHSTISSTNICMLMPASVCCSN